MSIYKILLNCVIGYGAILFFLGAARIIKTKNHRGVAIAHILMGTSLFVGIILDIIQAFFLSEASEKTLRIIQHLDANITGYFLGLVTFYLLCTQFKKKDKNPNQSVNSITGSAGSE
jgi:hypothetical protein